MTSKSALTASKPDAMWSDSRWLPEEFSMIHGFTEGFSSVDKHDNRLLINHRKQHITENYIEK